jgi:hypothetical protein
MLHEDNMSAISTRKFGLLATALIQYESGDCQIATVAQQNLPNPQGNGGAISGPLISGQEFKDLTQVSQYIWSEASEHTGWANIKPSENARRLPECRRGPC